VEAAVSASAPAPAPAAGERTEWRGEGVELDEVAGRLARMNRDHARAEDHAGHGHAATRTLNLLVAPGADVPDALVDARLDALATRHPSRTIVLREHAAARLDALLAIDCALGCGAGGTGWCHDTAVLRADAARLRHGDSLVHALLVAGLPTVLWLPGAQQSPGEGALAPLATAIVLDSGAAPDLPAALARAARLDASAAGDTDATARPAGPDADAPRSAPRAGDAGAAAPPAGRVRDLAWQRLARWRQRVAATFDDPGARALLARSERLEVRCGGADLAASLLLAGWIAARAGWTVERLGDDGGRWHGSARRADGAEVALAVGALPAAGEPGIVATDALGALAIGPPPPAPPRAEPGGIHALTLVAAGGERLRLDEPVAEPDAPRAFAAALRSFDLPAPGYAPALAALRAGLGPEASA
jgi:glucose-6-phosphate dehydrogenase assembly protein OpcA